MPTFASCFKPVQAAHAPANRLNLDYEAEAARLGPPIVPIIDVHSHIHGPEAARLYARAAELYGVELTWSMTHLEEIETVAGILGDRVRFIAVPDFRAEDRREALGPGYVSRIERFHAAGARIAKFWAAPRGRDYADEFGAPGFMDLDAPHRIEAMEAASALGMVLMTHVADPDTWFRTKYADASKYGTKAQQYEPLEMLLERFEGPWIAAHMGGWPEDLAFLDGLLERHRNLHLDTSATKWMVREISRHPRAALLSFLDRHRGRILFGSDIVTTDEHLVRGDDGHPMGQAASSPDEAFDLYASRYWALRVMFETSYVGVSPIADPDLAMVDPERWGPLDSPPLLGKALPAATLRSIYHDAAQALLEPYVAPEAPCADRYRG